MCSSSWAVPVLHREQLLLRDCCRIGQGNPLEQQRQKLQCVCEDVLSALCVWVQGRACTCVGIKVYKARGVVV